VIRPPWATRPAEAFDEAPAAHHYIHDRKAIGKVLLIP
jgi:hypothetical protein